MSALVIASLPRHAHYRTLLPLEEALCRQSRAADLKLSDRTRLEAGRIVRGQGPRIAPVPVEIGDLLGGGGAADVEQQATAADGKFIRDDFGLGRQQRRVVRCLDRIRRTCVKSVGGEVESF